MKSKESADQPLGGTEEGAEWRQVEGLSNGTGVIT